jgi:hypothetical protein
LIPDVVMGANSERWRASTTSISLGSPEQETRGSSEQTDVVAYHYRYIYRYVAVSRFMVLGSLVACGLSTDHPRMRACLVTSLG